MWKNKTQVRGYSRPVLLVSLISTSLGVFIMLASAFIAKGFQKEIRTKVTGFGAHLQIVPFGTGTSDEGAPMLIPQPYASKFRSTFPFAKSIYPFALKTGILQSRKKDEKGNRELQGVMCQSIASGFDGSFLTSFLESGKLPVVDVNQHPSDQILISASIASKLSCKTGDTIYLTLVSRGKDGTIAPHLHQMIISGVYRTGLEDMDSRFVYIDLGIIQESNAWGLEINPGFEVVDDNRVSIKLRARGGTGNYRFYTRGYTLPDSFSIPLQGDNIEIILTDEHITEKPLFNDLSFTCPDTLFIQFRDSLVSTTSDKKDWELFTTLRSKSKTWNVFLANTTSSHYRYAAGYAVVLDGLQELEEAATAIERTLPPEQGIRTVEQEYENIFNWLELIETNVFVIIILMIIVAIINMVSALLVLILERARFIGLMKTLGSTHGMLRRIFLILSFRQLVSGIILGNLLAVGLLFLQQQTGMLKLNPETYFVDTVPFLFDISSWITINLVTLGSCLVAVLLPTWLISGIRPVKAIRMQ
ncbi:MAG: ABC transporter permease [Flavobacteriales bacterium]